MTEREDELAWREGMLDDKEHELNRIEETFASRSIDHCIGGDYYGLGFKKQA
jgi:hypothetical protein